MSIHIADPGARSRQLAGSLDPLANNRRHLGIKISLHGSKHDQSVEPVVAKIVSKLT